MNAGARLTCFLLVVLATGFAIRRLRAPDLSLAVCSGCGKVRDGDGYWRDRKGMAQLAGGTAMRTKLCADCARKAYAAGDPPASFS